MLSWSVDEFGVSFAREGVLCLDLWKFNMTCQDTVMTLWEQVGGTTMKRTPENPYWASLTQLGQFDLNNLRLFLYPLCVQVHWLQPSQLVERPDQFWSINLKLVVRTVQTDYSLPVHLGLVQNLWTMNRQVLCEHTLQWLDSILSACKQQVNHITTTKTHRIGSNH